jgi:hypothetical protein
MNRDRYLAPSCEVTELEFREAVLNPVSANNEGYTTQYQYDDPFDDEV